MGQSASTPRVVKEPPTEEGPVGFDEAEHSVDGNGVVEVFADYRDLLVDAVDEGGAVAGPYEELLYSGGRSPPSTLS